MHVEDDFHDDELNMMCTTKHDVTDVKDAIVNQSTFLRIFAASASALNPSSHSDGNFGNISLGCS